jgi:hypothetical protein
MMKSNKVLKRIGRDRSGWKRYINQRQEHWTMANDPRVSTHKKSQRERMLLRIESGERKPCRG